MASMGKFKKKILLIALISVLLLAVNNELYADSVKSSLNYLIILVPGIGSNNKEVFETKYGNLKSYLKYTLELDGYVYPDKVDYNFNDTRGSNIDHARELADPSRSDNWFKKARQDFIEWFKTEGPGKDREIKDPLPEEIPSKYILIAHSEGGLAARAYLTSDFYNNDVVKLITIDAPHLGSDAVIYKKLLYSPENILGTMTTVSSPL